MEGRLGICRLGIVGSRRWLIAAHRGGRGEGRGRVDDRQDDERRARELDGQWEAVGEGLGGEKRKTGEGD